MSTKKLSLRLATHAMIAGLAFSSAGFAAVELAAPAVAQGGAVTNPAYIDASHDVSLTIHKKLNPTNRNAPTGKEDPSVTGEALNGVEFKITKLNYDLTTSEGLKAARAATVDDANNNKSDVTFTGVTANDGTVVFSTALNPTMTVGAYLVEETSTPRATIQPSKPFIVFLPMTDTAARNGWLYDVVAYPKNTETKVTKDVKNEDADKVANVGDVIHYDVTATRPAIDPRRSYFNEFVVYDQVPAGLSYDEAGEEPKVVLGSETLVKDTDYTIVTNADPKVVAVKLTRSGLNKLTKANYGTELVVTFPFKVTGKDGAVSSVANVAGVRSSTADYTDPTNPTDPIPEIPEVPTDPTDPWNPTDPTDPTDPTTPPTGETWVPVKLTKVAAENAETKLEGATFNVYRCTKEGGVAGTDTATAKAQLQGDKLQVNGVTDFVTQANGELVIDALRLRKDRTENDGYCLVETKSPNGYELLPSPYFFRLAADPQAPFDLQIENISSKDNGFHLPATGGMGVGLLMALGAAVAGAGVVYARRTSRS